MRVTLIGADFEENLGVGMIAAAALKAGHDVEVVPFDTPEQQADVAQRTLATSPDVVGLSIQFQHRAHEFLGLSRRLCAAGFEGHITSGGQFPTLAWREVLCGDHGIDSVVMHEGERAFVDLIDALGSSRRTAEVPGLGVLTDDGVPLRTEPRRLISAPARAQLPWFPPRLGFANQLDALARPAPVGRQGRGGSERERRPRPPRRARGRRGDRARRVGPDARAAQPPRPRLRLGERAPSDGWTATPLRAPNKGS